MRGGDLVKQVTLLEELLKAAKECGAYIHLNDDISFTPSELAAFALRIRLEVLSKSRIAHLAVVETVDAAVDPSSHTNDVPLIRKHV